MGANPLLVILKVVGEHSIIVPIWRITSIHIHRPDLSNVTIAQEDSTTEVTSKIMSEDITMKSNPKIPLI